ncbi:MAG TPA: efflux RND transporter periplasmic adaptor subunit [Gemmatimonadaceae bacterium]
MNTTNHSRTAASLLLLGLAACSAKQADPAADSATGITPTSISLTADQRQRIEIVTVKPETFRPQIQATGTVAFNGDKSTQVLSLVSGPATRIVVQPGAVVSKGDPLAYVSSPDFAEAVASYRKAEAAYRNAKRIADRDSALFKNDALARSDLEQAQSDLVAADADREAAVQNMRALGVDEAQIQAVKDGKTAPIEAIIRAPIDGTVVEKLIAQGQLVQAGTTPCFTVADLSTMWVMTSVFAGDLHDAAQGQPADIITDASATPIHGRVDYVASLVDPGSKAVAVRVVAPNTNMALRRDMFVTVEIHSSAEHHGILVPSAAIMRDEQNLPFVYVAAASNGFLRRRVDLGSHVGDRYEVTNGLGAGDQVVGNGALFLQFGQSQ